MNALLVASLLLATLSAVPVAAADDIVCLGDGPLAFCVMHPREWVEISPPVYCLHNGEVQPCPSDDV